MWRALVGIALVSACGGDREADTGRGPPGAAPDVWDVSLQADPAGRAVVADVNGAPVYADCVARQADAHDLSRRAALDECVGFELLAQEADARGYRTHPEVLRAREQEMVRAFVEAEFEPGHESPDHIPEPLVRQTWERMVKADIARGYAQHRIPDYVLEEEFRGINYYRQKAPRTALPVQEWPAVWAILRVSDYFEGRTDVSNEEFLEVAERLAGSDRSTHPGKIVYFGHTSLIIKLYKDMAFEELEVGEVSQPLRTTWGWDAMILLDVVEPFETELAEVEDEVRATMFDAWRQREFHEWTQSLLGGEPTIDESWLARLAQADQDQRSLLR